MSLTVAQAYDDLRRKLGIMTGEASPAGVDADVVAAMNWALQTMWKAGADYFRREALSVALVAEALPSYTALGIVFTGLTRDQNTPIGLYFETGNGASTFQYNTEFDSLLITGEQNLTLSQIVDFVNEHDIITAALEVPGTGGNVVGYAQISGVALSGGAAAQSAYPLANTTQSILGPVKTATGALLRRVDDFGDVQNFGLLYLGQTTAPMTDGVPLAYHVRDTRTNADNLHLVTLHVMPAPSAAAVAAHSPLMVDGVKACKTYTTADIASTAAIQVADGYAESLFLPLARLQITRSHLFSQLENLERIQADAAMAMRTLGLEPEQKVAGEGRASK